MCETTWLNSAPASRHWKYNNFLPQIYALYFHKGHVQLAVQFASTYLRGLQARRTFTSPS